MDANAAEALRLDGLLAQRDAELASLTLQFEAAGRHVVELEAAIAGRDASVEAVRMHRPPPPWRKQRRRAMTWRSSKRCATVLATERDGAREEVLEGCASARRRDDGARIGAPGGGCLAGGERPARARDRRPGAHHRVPAERSLVARAAVDSRARAGCEGCGRDGSPKSRVEPHFVIDVVVPGVQRAGRRAHLRRQRAGALAARRSRRAHRRCVARSADRSRFSSRFDATRASAARAVAQRHQPGLHGHRQSRHAAVARGRDPAQLRHDRERGLARRDHALRGDRPAHRHDHPVLEQRGDLLVPAILREQSVAGRRRSRADHMRRSPPLRCPCIPTCRPASASASIIRRALLDEIGYFDAAAFGAGYGEENDLCLRAAKAGWRNVLADNAFVVHTGERSFAGRKAEVAQRNMARAPRAPSALHGHGARVHRRRSVAGGTRARAVCAWRSTPRRRVACCTSCITTAAAPSRTCARWSPGSSREASVAAHTIGVTTSPSRSRIAGRSRITRDDGIGAHVRARTRRERVVDVVRRRYRGVVRHYAHPRCTTSPDAATASSRRWQRLPIPVGYTVHDLNFACPTITMLREGTIFCGGIDRRSELHALPRAPGRVRAHRHRAMARAASRPRDDCGVSHRAVEAGRRR